MKIVFDQNTIVPVPKLGFAYYLNDAVTLRNNYFRIFRLPTFNDRYWPADGSAEGNPDLDPEDGLGADLILEYRKPALFTLESSLHASWYSNSISWMNTGGIYRPSNTGEALLAGSDNRIQSAFSDRIILSLSYSFVLTYVMTGDLSITDDRRIPYQPLHVFSAGIELLWNTGSLILSPHFESSRYTAVENINELDSFFTMNVSVNQKIGQRVLLYCTLNNIFNESYVTVEGYPMPGFSAALGIKMHIEGAKR
jgi:vitamin B12 transporter